MAENFDLVLEHLKAIRADIGGIKTELKELRARTASIEVRIAHLHSDMVTNLHSLDTLREDVDHIKIRLNLHDPEH